uniref:Uncharacterized protein n=1 Tax=Dunaliella tertiolecta TaxID=3047 RepID=A0A7S3R606_DUNTE|mmetsp:Transcript_25908/g.70238  ORF Transcript_25908/g.70238 Transcript_25908/m.70238 type:complete len:285 (-) Transcript_25908:597-1451(-)
MSMGQPNGAYVFAAGAVAGIVEGLSIQPLELVKTRFQINPSAPMQLFPTLQEIVREGGLRQLYRGGLPEIAGLVPRASAALSTLEFSKRTFRAWSPTHQLEMRHAYAAGALSGVSEAIAFSPFQVIKVRLMAKEHLGRYKNTADCLQKVVQNEGVKALAIGLGPTLFRNCIWNSIFYGSMHEVEAHHLSQLNSPILSNLRSFCMGLSVGVFATCFNAPFDVVKSRMQSQLPDQRLYTNTFQALAKINREEGPRALWRGFVPKAIRLGVGQSIGLICFQNLMTSI